MLLYLESSAVLSSLLGEPQQQSMQRSLESAERLLTSALTATECACALTRASLLKRITATEELAARQLLHEAELSWDILVISDEVHRRARTAFLTAPIRSLDAIHLASALILRETVGPLTILSIDERLRQSASELGFPLLPEQL